MTWQDKVVGQQEELKTVYEIIVNGRFPHATVIGGNVGYGTLPFALSIVQALCCKHVSVEGACGNCGPCRRIDELQHPDLHMSFPVVSMPDKNRGSTISDDFIEQWHQQLQETPYFSQDTWIKRIATSSANADINAAEVLHIIQQLGLRSFTGDIKIQLIWMAEQIGDQSNKLLKLIEEPPDNTYFLLITADLNRILPTILSRCQQIKLGPIHQEELSDYLISHHAISAESANAVASFSAGDYIEAQELLDVDHSEMLSQINSWWRVCYDYDIMSMIDWSKRYADLSVLDRSGLLKYALKLTKGILHVNMLGNDQKVLTNQELQIVKSGPFLAQLDIDQLHQLSEIISDLLYGIERNLHAKSQMFNSCLQIESTFKSRVMNAI